MSDTGRNSDRYGTLSDPTPIEPTDPDELMRHYRYEHGPPPDFVQYPRLLAQHRIAHVLAEPGPSRLHDTRSPDGDQETT